MCEECREKLEYIGKHSCHKCGKRLAPSNYENEICTDCSEKLRLFEQCFCVFQYNKSARKIAADFKYKHRGDKLEAVSFALAARLRPELKDIKIDLIVPVPIHKSRLKERGYNQAEIIAEIVGRALMIPVNNELLTRNSQTSAQNKLNRNQRIVNLRQAFSAENAKEIVKEAGIENILIIDDIYTTGATMEASAEALLAAEVKKVYGACIFAGPDK
ncbi:MAG: phosphoribosyltransferase family protein [Eubacteriales bacterium]|nr:phosphoribosyltransferase family protein [Eubacteriales bacterium]